jgi:hypothetical protein
MATSTFNMAKVSFTASFQVLLDNYLSRRSNEKYSSMDSLLTEMRENLKRARGGAAGGKRKCSAPVPSTSADENPQRPARPELHLPAEEFLSHDDLLGIAMEPEVAPEATIRSELKDESQAAEGGGRVETLDSDDVPSLGLSDAEMSHHLEMVDAYLRRIKKRGPI